MTYNLDSQSVTKQVVQVIAEAEQVPPTELTPLGEIVDPDALDTLFSPPSKTKKELHFEYEGYTVVIDENRTISLE